MTREAARRSAAITGTVRGGSGDEEAARARRQRRQRGRGSEEAMAASKRAHERESKNGATSKNDAAYTTSSTNANATVYVADHRGLQHPYGTTVMLESIMN
ncbi:hypothetical protein ACOSQ2_022557 [Xanthoceras sorbifolium]